MPRVRIADHFSELTDPRKRKVTHSLINVITIAICAVVAGADDFVAIADYGRKKKAWLAEFLDLKGGIPSHDRFNAILAALQPAEFEKCLLSWIMSLHEVTAGQIIAIDGKTLRRSYDTASGKSAIHMVSAWATANQISLGQVVTNEKSNEITAIPDLLEMLEIQGCLVTIDALGCQVDIAQKILDREADYVLAVKGNQRTLHENIQRFFAEHVEDNFSRVQAKQHQTSERGHGREEDRSYVVCPVPEEMYGIQRWPKLKALGMVIHDTLREGKCHTEIRYYILSKKLSAKRFAEAVRGHWSIENRLHWQLDVTFGEDQCRLRKGHADANFSILRRTALSLLKNNKTLKLGIKNKRLSAGWDNDYLQQVILNIPQTDQGE